MTTRELDINGIRMHVRDEGTGDPVLLLHGWPDSSALWRHQVPPLVAAGYRAIAPDLRGFGKTEKPQAVEAYRLETLLGDVLGLLDALEIPRAHVVSHDWGAIVGWALAMFAPARVVRHVVLSVGHPAHFREAPIEQREMSWYVLFFQFANVAEEALRANDWKLFRQLCRDHPEVRDWIRAMEEPGALTAGLNWYRANLDPAHPLTDGEFPDVEVPTLGIWSSGEHYLLEAQMKNSEQQVKAAWRYERLEGASHWMQLDQPEALTELILAWLGDRSPGS